MSGKIMTKPASKAFLANYDNIVWKDPVPVTVHNCCREDCDICVTELTATCRICNNVYSHKDYLKLPTRREYAMNNISTERKNNDI